jgi:hypothetical protein
MLFGVALGVERSPLTVSTPGGSLAPSPCGELKRIYGQLFVQVTTGIFKAEAFLKSGPATVKAHAAHFMRLADDSRKLGKVAGQIDACGAVRGTVTDLKRLLRQNTQDLLLTEFRLNEAWGAGSYAVWMKLRTKVQNYHRVVAKLTGWLVKAAAVVGPRVGIRLPDLTVVSVVDASPAADPPGAVTVVDLPPEPGAEPVAEELPGGDEKPFYRKGWFWGLMGAGVVAVVVGRKVF